MIKCEPVSGKLPNNNNNIILDCEEALLQYVCGGNVGNNYVGNYKVVIVNSATNAIGLCVFVNELFKKYYTYEIPERTYISVPQAIKNEFPIKTESKIVYKDIKWVDTYQIGNIVDSAAYLPKGDINKLFTEDIDYVVLSFGNQKPLAANQGGAIIMKNENYDLFKRLSHNGRDSALPVVEDTLLEINAPHLNIDGIYGRKVNLVPELVLPILNKFRYNHITKNHTTYFGYPTLKI